MSSNTALFRDKPRLQGLLKELPALPGIYRFYDVTDAIVYVGKSVCLKDRVRSYFTGQATTKKLRRMRQEIAHLDWQETGSELEALLLESRLVKRHQPRFNVMLREFVPRPCVRVDLRDPFPRLEVTRAPSRDGAAYFGPFYSQGALEAAVKGLSDALRLRDCSIPGEKLSQQRPCYRHEFGTCAAPCLGLVGAEEYGQAVRKACAALEGEEDSALQALQRRMERAAELLRFELAARLRDAMRHIRAVCGRQHALHSAVRDLSLVAACPSRQADRLCLFVFRSGRLVLQTEPPTAELAETSSRRLWATRLVVALQGTGEAEERIDAALLDEIQIVTGWMRQNTREGAYWQLAPAADPAAAARELDLWLAAQAPEVEEQLAA